MLADMAYQNLKIHPPRLRHSDELLNFTQSVVNMEREISQVSKNRKPKSYEIHNPQNFSEQLIVADTHERRAFEMQKNVNFSPVELEPIAQENKEVKRRDNLGRKRQMSLSDDRDKPGFGKGRVGHQDVKKHGGHWRKLPDNVIWTPSKIRDVDGFENRICNISLSRVYFAQQFDGKDHHLVAADGEECAVSGPEKLECRNFPQKNTRLVRQKNAPMVILNRRQSAPSPLTNSVPKPTRIRGMFRNQTDCGINKRADTRRISETQEYVYFLPQNQESKEECFRCNALSPDAKSEPSKNEHLLPEKRFKNKHVSNQVVLDTQCVDEVATGKMQRESKNCAQSSQLQVVADSDGRILVNIPNNYDNKHNIEAQKPIIGEEADISALRGNNKDLGGDYPGTVTSQKDHLQKANHAPIEREKACYQTSILITNDQQWDSWKRVNCIPSEDDTLLNHSKRQGYLAKPGHHFFDDGHEIISSRSEDVNNVHGPPHPSKLIHHTARQCTSDNSAFCDPEVVVMQDSSYSKYYDEQNPKNITCTTHSQRYFERSSNAPEKSGSRISPFRGDSSTSSASKEREFGSHQRVGGGGYQAGDAGVSMAKVSGRKIIRSHNLEPQGTLSYSFQVLDKDASFERSGEPELRQKAAIMTGENLTDTPILLHNNFDVHTSCSGLGNKNDPCRLGGLRPTNQRKNANTVPSTTDIVEKRKSELLESFTTYSDSETESRYNCDWPACKKSFRHYSFLVLHKRIHTGERPYVCSWKGCTKQFRRSDDYQRHYRVHTGAKPYVCTFCGKGFKRSDHRLFHYRAIHDIKDSKIRKRK